MEIGLFEALRRYSPREGNDPLENFITEGFAWLLNKYPDFSELFLQYLGERLQLNVNRYDYKWNTQVNFDGKRPDMVYRWDNKAIVFEHKTWDQLGKDQLKNYRKYANQTFQDSHIVLITATRQQHKQNPDLALCWSDIYNLISCWEQKTNIDIPFLLKDFQNLLKGNGLGPPAPVSHAAIRSYYEVKDMEQSLEELIKRVQERGKQEEEWKRMIKKDYLLEKDSRWGRMGISLLDGWYPDVLVGILLNGTDHRTEPIDYAKGPDFCLILGFDKPLHDTYSTNEHYLKLLCNVQQKLNDGWNGWKFYNHLEEVERPNRYHPIHIRKSLLDVFAGTESYEEQEKKFYNAASELIKLVAEEESFWKLREYCKEQDAQR